MHKSINTAIVILLALSLTTTEAWSRGFGGGGGRPGGGGGGAAMRGGGGAAMRTPSMSRPTSRPQQNFSRPSPTTRPSTGYRPSTPSRPNTGYRPNTPSRPNVNQPNINRPNINNPGANRPSTNRPSTNRPNISNPNINRPNQGRPDFSNRPDLNRPDFSNRPDMSNRLPSQRPAFADRPSSPTRPSPGDLEDFLDLPGGVNRPSTLPSDKRPDLSQFDRPSIDRPAIDRPNIDRPKDRPNIDRDKIDRDNINIGNRVGDNNININRKDNINSIRNHWSNIENRPFHKDWWTNHPHYGNGWRWHGGWGRYPNYWCWRHCSWGAFGTWFVWNAWADPVVYDYGSNVVYQDNYVYVNDQQYATQEEYYQQAEELAQSVPADIEPEKVEWMPLGVFAIAEEDGVDNGMLIQLAVSKEGIIAGTFYNDATDDGRPLEGTVDRETQRAAWKFADGKNENIVMETAIYNLTQEESTALVHFGEEETQTWLMVRLPEEEEQE